MKQLNVVEWIALGILVIGGLNWALIGSMNTDVVSAVFGVMTTLTRVIYVIVGIAAVYAVYIFATKTA